VVLDDDRGRAGGLPARALEPLPERLAERRRGREHAAAEEAGAAALVAREPQADRGLAEEETSSAPVDMTSRNANARIEVCETFNLKHILRI